MAINTINNPNTYVGDLNNLTTSNKSNVVGAVNELNSKIGLKLINSPSFALQNNNGIYATVPTGYDMAILTICENASLQSYGISNILMVPRGGICWATDGTANAKQWEFKNDGTIVGSNIVGDQSTHWKIFSVYGVPLN